MLRDAVLPRQMLRSLAVLLCRCGWLHHRPRHRSKASSTSGFRSPDYLLVCDVGRVEVRLGPGGERCTSVSCVRVGALRSHGSRSIFDPSGRVVTSLNNWLGRRVVAAFGTVAEDHATESAGILACAEDQEIEFGSVQQTGENFGRWGGFDLRDNFLLLGTGGNRDLGPGSLLDGKKNFRKCRLIGVNT